MVFIDIYLLYIGLLEHEKCGCQSPLLIYAIQEEKKNNTCMFLSKKKNNILPDLEPVLLNREIASKDVDFLQIVPVVTVLQFSST